MTQIETLPRELNPQRLYGVKESGILGLMRIARILGVVVLIQIGAHGIAASPSKNDKRLSFTVPAAPWTLTLPAHDFVVQQEKIKPDGRYGYFYLIDRTRSLNVSFFIEPVNKCKDSKSCRDLIWKSGNPMWENPKNVMMSQIGDISVFEFLLPSLKGVPFQQQNMYAQFVVDGFWVDLHMSKVLYKPAERKLFEDLVKALKFEPKEKRPRAEKLNTKQNIHV